MIDTVIDIIAVVYRSYLDRIQQNDSDYEFMQIQVYRLRRRDHLQREARIIITVSRPMVSLIRQFSFRLTLSRPNSWLKRDNKNLLGGLTLQFELMTYVFICMKLSD